MKTKIAFSVFIGVVFAVVTFLLSLLIVPPSTAAVFSLIALGIAPPFMHASLAIEERRNNKRFVQVERDQRISYYHKVNGNFVWGKALNNGNVYFCEGKIVVVSVEKKPYLIVEFQDSEISKCDFEDIHMHLYLTDGKELHVMMPNARESAEIIRAHRRNG